MNLVGQVKQAGAGWQVIADAGVLVNAVVLSCPHPDVWRKVV